MRDLLKKPVFEKSGSNWLHILPIKTKQYNNRTHTSNEITPIQASFKKNEGYVYKNFLIKRNKANPKFQVNDLVRIADLKKKVSERDTTNWSYKLCKVKKLFLIQYRVVMLTI